MKKLVIWEFVVLLFGTIFAWTNFGIELYDYLNRQVCSVGCSAFANNIPANTPVNPIYTPCFYGAVFFAIALVLISIILKKTLKSQKPEPILKNMQ